MPELKTAICDAIDRAKDELLVLSHDIHDDPELSGQEYRASGRICDFLSGKNFEITREFCGEKTAFKARLSSQKPGPVIAFIAEYAPMRRAQGARYAFSEPAHLKAWTLCLKSIPRIKT